jgi:hypothetical protein
LWLQLKILTSDTFPFAFTSKNTFSFVITNPVTADLAANSCDIWFSGYDSGAHFDDLAAFIANDGFVMSGCDASSNDAACAGVGFPVTNYSNITVTFTNGLNPINPLTCDAGSGGAPVVINTAGGASGYFTTGIALAQYTDASALPEVITDSLSDPTVFLTADINMWDSMAGVTAGPTVTSDQDKFAVNSFKFSADAVSGLIAANGGSSCDLIPATPTTPDYPPSTASVSLLVNADTTASLDLSAHISDPDGDADLTTIDIDLNTTGIQQTYSSADGVWTLSGVVLSFNPNMAFEGISTISYVVLDDAGNQSIPATISVTVEGAIPIATNDTTSVLAGENAELNLTDNVTDANNDVVIATIDLEPTTTGLQSTLNTPAGVWSVSSIGVLTFDPITSFEGVTTIQYAVSDDDDNVSLPAVVTITVGSAQPVADDDTVSVVQNTVVSIDVLNGDNDANDDIDESSIDLDPTVEGSQNSLAVALTGIYEVSEGRVIFTPDPAFYGTSRISYTVQDTQGNISNVASIEVLVLLDSDGDGTANIDDVDDDNDGIPDLIEGDEDTDADGVIDSLDRDSDNDGITDTREALGSDVDGDGVIDGFIDEDGDGHDDSVSATPLLTPNTDGDTLPDYKDVDSDNDGLTDAYEAGRSDEDANGEVDGFLDANNDGLDDAIALAPIDAPDSDADELPDYRDLDSDDDSIPDAIESNADSDADGLPDYIDLDSDGDGFADQDETDIDSDNDGKPDFLDTDADNDGLSDTLEGAEDTDGDGTPNYLDLDSDNDGIPDSEEASFRGLIPYDRDNDLTYDFLDVDSDNDGISDRIEGFADFDGDGIQDFRDLDVDNDGIYDLIEIRIDGIEAAILDADNNGVIDSRYDLGANGMADVVETEQDSGDENYELSDKDSDSVLDFRDHDSDNDGLLDTTESDHLDGNLDGIIDSAQTGRALNDAFTSMNNDLSGIESGVAEGAGKIPRNSDEDSLRDFRDRDSDNDGLMDIVESFGIQHDQNNDGAIDDFIDTDGDGVSDVLADDPLPPFDTDSDGTPDALEVDSDGDGLSDAVESGGLDMDGDGRLDEFLDADNDGVDDGVEVIALGLQDTDGDGLPDYRDLDSDGDGLTDLQEGGAMDADGDGVADALVASNARPDMNGDGTPDHMEVIEPVDLGAAVGTIKTGLTGQGCSIASRIGHTNTPSKTYDPLFLCFMSFAFLWLLVRRGVRVGV